MIINMRRCVQNKKILCSLRSLETDKNRKLLTNPLDPSKTLEYLEQNEKKIQY